jgi:hypothetical protein
MWYIGLILALLGNIIGATGSGFNKYGSKYYPENTKKWMIAYYTCIVIGFLGDFGGLYFASPSVIMPMAGIIFPVNYIIGRYIFKETAKNLYPTIAIMFSVVFIIIVTEPANCNEYEKCLLSDHWSGILFLIYLALLVSLIIMLVIFIKKTKHLEIHKLDQQSNLPTYVETSSDKSNRLVNLNGVCVCVLSGFFSAMALLFVKIILELIKTGFQTQLSIGLFFIFFTLLILSFIITC